VIEEVVELGAELNLQALYRRIELLVEGQIGLVERRRAAGLRLRLPKGLGHCRQRL